MRGHVIVCGMGHVGTRIVGLLTELGEPVCVITQGARPERLRAAQAAGAKVIVGDARDENLLHEAEVEHARAVIAATGSDMANIEIALDSKRLAPGVSVVSRLFDQHLARSFEHSFDIRRALASSVVAAPAFVAAALGDPRVAAVTLGSRSYVVDQAHVLTDEDEWRRARMAELVVPPRPKRWLGTLRSIWAGAPRALRRAFLTLLALLALSVLVFKLAMQLDLVDALYFIITTVTTVGYGDITPLRSPALVKLYACCVMLFGSAMIAVLYSFVTDFVVTERFRSLFHRKEIPEAGHVLVVGFGDVGYRVVKELLRIGVRTVAIDVNGDGKFVADVGELAPMLIGDARLVSTLHAARVERAIAVIAVTGDDAANLSVALAAKQLNPKIRTVTRLFDHELATKVERGLKIDSALSASMISSPMLVASALFAGARGAWITDGWLYCLCEQAAGPTIEGEIVMRRGAGQTDYRPGSGAEAADDMLLVLIRRPLKRASAATTPA